MLNGIEKETEIVERGQVGTATNNEEGSGDQNLEPFSQVGCLKNVRKGGKQGDGVHAVSRALSRIGYVIRARNGLARAIEKDGSKDSPSNTDR